MRPVHGYAVFLLIRAAFGAIFMAVDGKGMCKVHETPKKSHLLRLPWQKLWSFKACAKTTVFHAQKCPGPKLNQKGLRIAFKNSFSRVPKSRLKNRKFKSQAGP